MKRKSFITILAVVLTLVLSVAVLSACNDKKHEYSSEWKFDQTSHWHECTTKKHSDTSEKIAHDFNDGEVTKAPTEEVEGVKTFTCNTCGYQKTEVVEKLTHTHTFATEWSKNETEHWRAATCAHTSEKADVAMHSWDEGQVTKEPTETEEGEKTYTCLVCGQTKTESVGTLAHTHTFDTSAWAKDEINHWHPATCTHTSEKKDVAAHSWNDGEVTTSATEEADGVKTYTCTVCGQTKTEAIPALGHEHTYATEWSKNDAEHWHAATCKHTTLKKDVAAHSWNGGEVTTEPTEEAEGVKTYTCTVCGQTKTEAIAKLPHTHKYNMTAWVNTDESGHYRPTTCEHEDKTKDFAEHTYTDDDDFDCNVCGYEREATDNTLTLSVKARTYNGAAQALSASEYSYAGGKSVSVMYKAKGAEDSAYSSEAPKNAGEYTVKVSVEGNAVYKAIEKTADFAIAQKGIRLSGTYWVYDANGARVDTVALIETGGTSQVIAGETVLVKIDTTGLDVGANISVNTTERFSLTGEYAANYKITSVDCGIRVEVKTISVTSTVKVNGVENSSISANAEIVYGATSFEEHGEEGSIETYLNSNAKGKNVTINVYVKGNDEVTLARYERVGTTGLGKLHYRNNYGDYTEGTSGPGTYTYDFVYNYYNSRQYVTNYVWVYDTDSVELVFDIVITEPTNLYNDSVDNKQLVVGKSDFYKVAINDESTSTEVEITISVVDVDGFDCEVAIYGADGYRLKNAADKYITLNKTNTSHTFTITSTEVFYVYVQATGTTDSNVTYTIGVSETA